MRGAVTIRRADRTDLDAVVGFGAAVVPPHYAPIIGEAAARQQVEAWWTPERLGVAADGSRLFVAELDGTVVGVAERGEWDGDPVIWKLYVHPDHRGKRIGVALLDAVVADVADRRRVLLEHMAGNTRAAAFYEREGFRHLRTDPAPNGDPAAATVWRVREPTVTASAPGAGGR